MGSKSDGGQAAMIQSMIDAGKKAAKQFEGLEKELPDVEKMKLALEAPELFLSAPEEKLARSAFEQLQLDPRLQQTQEEVLGRLEQLSREGLTAEDLARREELRRQATADEQARQSSILASMAARGAGGSGAELAARLASSQGSAQKEQQASLALAADIEKARREALAQQGQYAGQLSQQDLATKQQQAQARDQIAAFNAAVSARDTEARRQREMMRADLANQQQQYNKELAQRKYENLFNLQQAKAGALTGQAGHYATAASMARPQASGLAKALGGAASMAGAGYMMGGGMGAGIGAGVGALGGLIAKDGGVKYDNGGIGFYEQRAQEAQERRDLAQQEAEFAKHFQPSDFDLTNMQPNGLPANGEQTKKEGTDFSQLGAALSQISKIVGPEEEQRSMIAPPSRLQQVDPGSLSKLPSYQQLSSKFKYADGGVEKMGYEEGGTQTDGRITPGDSFSGDQLPDRINSKELVANVNMQQNLEDLLRELQKYRVDKMLDEGKLKINPEPQEELLGVLRGEKPLERADFSKNIIETNEPKGLRLLEEMIKGK